MNNLAQIKSNLKRYRTTLREEFKVVRLGVFGSYARGTPDEESDVDILVELAEPLGLKFIDLKDYLEQILGLKVDLVTHQALKPRLRDSILAEVQYT